MGKRKIVYVCISLLVFLLVGCAGDDENAAKSDYYMYYVNNNQTKLVQKPFEVKSKKSQDILKELLTGLDQNPKSVDYQKAKPDNIQITNRKLKDGQLTLYFNSAYFELPKVTEVLCRAAIVKTLIQVKTVDYVSFYVNEAPLKNSNDEPIGLMMNGDTFVENKGQSINSYQVAELALYFANEKGDKLVQENVSIRYSSNISLEKLIVERLMKGPANKKLRKTIPEGTKASSVTMKDGICYVNFDSTFIDQSYDLPSELIIYSIVNSLTEVPNVNQVQISVDGKTDLTFGKDFSLDTLFERNLDLLESKSEENKEGNKDESNVETKKKEEAEKEQKENQIETISELIKED